MFGLWQLPFIVSLYLVAVYRLSPCPRSLHFAIWSTMGNLTTHGWLTALHHQLIDRAVSLPLLLTKPKWCRTNLTSFLTGSLSFSSISHVLIFSLPCSLNVLMDTRATACCEITPVGWPIRDWISQPHHCHHLWPSFTVPLLFIQCCTIFTGSGSSRLRLMYHLCGLNGSCFFVYWVFFCILTWATDESVWWRCYGFT